MAEILITGGYGEVGRRVAQILAPEYPGRIAVAGRRLKKAQSLASDLGNGVIPVELDVHDASTVGRALDGVRVVVNCIDLGEPHLLREAVRRGLGYVDMTAAYALWLVAREMTKSAEESGARVVVGAGLNPGIASVMARYAAERLGGATTVHTSLLLSLGDSFGPAPLAYLMLEASRSFQVIEGRRQRDVWPFTDPAVVRFPMPYGDRLTYRAPFSDQFFFPRTLGVQSAISRLALEPAWVGRALAQLMNLGLPRLLRRARVRAIMLRAVHSLHARNSKRNGFALVVEVDSGAKHARLSLSGQVQARATAAAAALIARGVIEGEITRAGVWTPEEVIEPIPFFAQLHRLGLDVTNDADGSDSSISAAAKDAA